MSFLAGQEVEADDLNPPAGKISLSSAQSIPNATATTIALDTVEHNYRGVVDAANNRLVVPSGEAGLYCISLTVQWVVNTTGSRTGFVDVNGTTVVQESGGGLNHGRGGGALSMTTEENLAVGDALTGGCFQNSGASLDLATVFGGCHLSMFLVRRS